MPPEHTEYVGPQREQDQQAKLTLHKALVNPNKFGPPDLPGSYESSELSLRRRPRPGVNKEAVWKAELSCAHPCVL